MKKIFLTLSLVIMTINFFGQSIDNSVLAELQSSFKISKSDIALQNAIINNEIKSLAEHHSIGAPIDNHFKYEIETGSITDQKHSGRCWMFTSLNVFRPKVIQKFNLSDFEFSESYLYFWDILEKSNTFLEFVISSSHEDIYSRQVHTFFDSPVGDGGAWNTFTNLVSKYGVVPKSVMPESKQTENTSTLLSLINKRLRKGGIELRDLKSSKTSDAAIQSEKIKILKDVYRILVLSLGEPPQEFEWRYKDKDNTLSEYKKYTPQSFWSDVVGANTEDYVMFIDDPTIEYYKLYRKENDKNVYEGIDWTFVNVPTSELKKYALESIKDNEILYFSCDVGKQLQKTDGTLSLKNFNYTDLFGVNFEMSRAQRMQTHQSGSSHGMALCGVDVDENGATTKWKIENSWGADYGANGYLIMTDEWFTQYFFRLVVNKKYLPNKIINILDQDPETVPYYIPAYSPELD